MSKIKITSLYDQYKNTNKKLKIVCDWDEVIQACEPYALCNEGFSSKFFEVFWKETRVKYSPYGSHLEFGNSFSAKKVLENQKEIKNSPNFYQQAPFLTIAEDLLKLIREDKIEKLIFLSAYDKREFPTIDLRKTEIFNETFGKFLGKIEPMLNKTISEMEEEMNQQIKKGIVGTLKLIPFDSENQGQSKADWIKDNASDFDIVIDDNPNICKSVVKDLYYYQCEKCRNKNSQGFCSECPPTTHRVIAPYYPATENQHHSEVILVKNEVSNLKKEDFNK